MATWTNFAARGGAAVSSWRFDKAYADSNGPGYTYTAGGKLRTRTWACGITTTHETNAATEIVGITYCDGSWTFTQSQPGARIGIASKARSN